MCQDQSCLPVGHRYTIVYAHNVPWSWSVHTLCSCTALPWLLTFCVSSPIRQTTPESSGSCLLALVMVTIQLTNLSKLMHLTVKWNLPPLDYYTKSFPRQCVCDWIKLVRSSVAYLHFCFIHSSINMTRFPTPSISWQLSSNCPFYQRTWAKTSFKG